MGLFQPKILPGKYWTENLKKSQENDTLTVVKGVIWPLKIG
jgi:hypothetical protein